MDVGPSAAGWGISRLLRAGRDRRVALMYGLGMNNNGTGLVMASMALTDHQQVLLPIIFYNLVQHLAAGTADRFFGHGEAAREVTGEGDDEIAPLKVVGTWERLSTSR
jgi:predicted Na+-dependent transporter